MKETVKKNNINFSNTDKLIALAIVLLIVIAVFIGGIEIRVICIILCLLGVFTMLISRSSKGKKSDQFGFEFEDTLPIINEDTSDTKSKRFDTKNPYLEKDFIMIKSLSQDSEKNNENNQRDEITEVSNERSEYNNLSEDSALEKNKTGEQHSSFEIFPKKNDIISKKDPKAEFNFFLNKILEVIKELMFGYTVLFYWVDFNNKAIVLEAWVTSSKKFSQKRKDMFEYNANLVGKVIQSNKVEVITNINSDSIIDLLGYYHDKEDVNSVIGVPIFYDGSLIAVLVVDSKEEDSFGMETIEHLNRFVVLLTNLIKSSAEKFDYYVDSQILKKLDHIQSILSNTDLNTFVLEVSHLFKELVEWDCSTLITYDGKNFIVNEVTKKEPLKSYVSMHEVVDIYKSLVGSVIQKNRFVIISDTSELQQPRFFADENIINNSGSLLVMPIYSVSNTYGAMLFESNKKNYYSSEDATLLNKVCKLLSSSIEIVSLSNYIDQKVIIDDTDILKPDVMLNQLSIELSRQTDLGIAGILLMFSVDKNEEYISKYGLSEFRNILLSVINIIKSSIPTYDVIGKIEDNIIAVHRLALNLDDGKVYAEKTRKLIAGNIITTFDKKSFSITVSIGLVETHKFKDTESMIDSCKRVLKIAINEGGNRVKIN